MTKRRLIVALTLVMFIAVPLAHAADAATNYKAKCAMCHGPDGAGQTPTGKTMKVRDLRVAEVQKQTDAELVKWISDGKGKMPAYKGKLTPAEIDALVAFLRTLKK